LAEIRRATSPGGSDPVAVLGVEPDETAARG
jgi:hypothetical protein